MAINYTSLRDNLVEPRIREYGKSVTLRRPGVATGYTKTYNPGEGRYQWVNNNTGTIVYVDPSLTPTDTLGYAVEKKYKQDEIDGSTVLATDRRFVTIDLPAPTSADKLVVAGKVLTIVNVMQISPGDVVLLYELQCRGSA